MHFLETVECSNVRPSGNRCSRLALATEHYCKRCLREGANPVADLREANRAERQAQAEARAEVRKRNERLYQARKPGGGLGKKTKFKTERELAEKRARQLETSRAGPKKGSTHEVKGSSQRARS